MSNPWAIALVFVALFACIVDAVMTLRDKLYGLAVFYILLAIMFAYALTQIPAPVSVRQEQPTPYPTATPASGWQDFYDALVVTDAQLDFRLAAVETYIWSPTVTPNYPATPVSSPTSTPTATPAICKPCSYDGECGPGLRCYLCADKHGRCVLSGFANSSCRTCIETGR